MRSFLFGGVYAPQPMKIFFTAFPVISNLIGTEGISNFCSSHLVRGKTLIHCVLVTIFTLETSLLRAWKHIFSALQVAYNISNLHSVSENSMSFVLQYVLRLSWYNPQLRFDPRQNNGEHVLHPFYEDVYNQLWVPDLVSCLDFGKLILGMNVMLRKKVSHIQICDPSKKIKRSLALKMLLYLLIL